MRKIVSIMLALILNLNIVLGYTVTMSIKGIDLVVTGEPGNEIEIDSKVEGITGWSVKQGDITITDNKFIMPSEDVVVEAIFDTADKFLLTVDTMLLTREEEKPAGEVITVETKYEDSGYIFTSWEAIGIELTESQKVNPSITFTMPWNPVTLVANYKDASAPWNSPVLAEGLTPVNWNGSTWVTTTEDNWDYNYDMATAGHETVEGDGTAKWANAQTADGSQYVWIPRYSYKITSGYHSSGNSWSSVDNPGSNKIEIKFSNGIEDEVTEGAANASEGYIAHPAFTFGTDELEGIWVAKYKASRNDATSSSEGSGTTIRFKPGVVAWRGLSVSDSYDYSYNLNRDLDSHLMKNSEWGAVAYLTNAIGKIPYVNNSSSRITGNAGGSQDAASVDGVTNEWNTAGGVKASTTHNVYGIYDLSGGNFEFVSAYYEGGDSTYLADDEWNNSYAGRLYSNRDTKYVETYQETGDSVAYSSDIIGDAVYETSGDFCNFNTGEGDSEASWDGDTIVPPNYYLPVFIRGGYSNYESSAGIFCLHGDPGYMTAMEVTFMSFRAVLAPQRGGSEGTSTQSYIVSYNANGGEGSITPQIFVSGVAKNLTTNTFTRDGYIFKGWSTTAGGNVQYTDGASYTATSNVTLYAVWEELPRIEDLPLGVYIAYTPSNETVTASASGSGTGSNQIYYPKTYTEGWKVFANNNGQLDIISAENVLTDSSGTESTLTLHGSQGYANAVYALNTLSEGYINPAYAIAGRSLGYVEGSSTETIVANFPTTREQISSNGNNGFPWMDTLNEYDRTIIDTEINGEYPLRSSDEVWLASRNISGDASEVHFLVRYLQDSSGGGNGLYTSGGASYSASCGVRPVISLKPGMVITGGSGTKDDPYTIDVSSAVSGYIVTFNANGGSGAMSWQIFAEGEAQNLSTNTFTRYGYEFLGWSTDSDATTATYTDGQSYTATSDVTLYAVWEELEMFTVTITAASGTTASVTVAGVQYSSSTSVTVPSGSKITCTAGTTGKITVEGSILNNQSYCIYTVTENVKVALSGGNVTITLNSSGTAW